MSDDNQKKVVLGSTLALLIGAGAYWFLGSGGASDSDGLNSRPPGPKVARVIPSDDSKEKDLRRHSASDRGRPPNIKEHRYRPVTKKHIKTNRPRHSNKVTRKKESRPQA